MKLGRALARTIIPAVSVVLVAAAATTNVAASAAAKNFDTCSVVTQAEAAAAIGEKVSHGFVGHATVEGGQSCVFFGPSEPSRNANVALSDEVRVVVVKGPDALKYYKDYKSRFFGKAISGYGDQAFWDGFASLSVLKGAYYARIAVSPATSGPSLKDEEKLAKAILPKL
jgi:hypothetical protein